MSGVRAGGRGTTRRNSRVPSLSWTISVRPPRTDSVAARHDPRARTKLPAQEGFETQVQTGRQIEGHDGGVRELRGQRVAFDESHAVADAVPASRHASPIGLRGFQADPDAAGSEPQRRHDRNDFTGAEIGHDVVRSDARQPEHLLGGTILTVRSGLPCRSWSGSVLRVDRRAGHRAQRGHRQEPYRLGNPHAHDPQRERIAPAAAPVMAVRDTTTYLTNGRCVGAARASIARARATLLGVRVAKPLG